MGSSARHMLLLWLPILNSYVAAQSCYRQNGSLWGQGDYYVCDTQNDFSMCCGTDSMCTTNGLCKSKYDVDNNEGNVYWRTGCTDQTWRSPFCSGFCNATTAEPNAPGGSHKVIACSSVTYCCAGPDIDTSNDPYFCCPGNSSGVSDSELLTLGAANYLAGNPVAVTLPPNPSPRPATTTTSSMSSTQTPIPTTATASASSTPASNDNGLSTGAQAGIGVGVALGVVAAIAVGILLYLRQRKRRRNEDESRKAPMEERQEAYSDPGPFSSGKDTKQQDGTMISGLQEMDSHDRRHEIYTEDRRAELPGDEGS